MSLEYLFGFGKPDFALPCRQAWWVEERDRFQVGRTYQRAARSNQICVAAIPTPLPKTCSSSGRADSRGQANSAIMLRHVASAAGPDLGSGAHSRRLLTPSDHTCGVKTSYKPP